MLTQKSICVNVICDSCRKDQTLLSMCVLLYPPCPGLSLYVPCTGYFSLAWRGSLVKANVPYTTVLYIEETPASNSSSNTSGTTLAVIEQSKGQMPLLASFRRRRVVGKRTLLCQPLSANSTLGLVQKRLPVE